MHLFDLRIPFFLPVWRRLVVVAICLLWASVEFATASPFWGVLFGSVGLYAGWQFFFTGWPGPDDDPGDSQ